MEATTCLHSSLLHRLRRQLQPLHLLRPHLPQAVLEVYRLMTSPPGSQIIIRSVPNTALMILLGATIYPPKRNNGPMGASSSTLWALLGHMVKIWPLVLVIIPLQMPLMIGSRKLHNTIPAIQWLRILLKWSGSQPRNLVARSQLAMGFSPRIMGLHNTMYVSITLRVM
jgi:hypothetical protein